MTEGAQHRSFCRICNAMCGIVVTVGADGTVEQVRGDADHALSRGYTCPKGRAIPALHHDARRLDQPLVGRGHERHPAAWDDVLDDLEARVRDTVEANGPDSVAMYLASGSAFDAAGRRAAERFLTVLGSRQRYTATTIDTPCKPLVAELVAGWSGLTPIWDEERSSLLVLFGSNPVVSHGHSNAVPDPVARLRELPGPGRRGVGARPPPHRDGPPRRPPPAAAARVRLVGARLVGAPAVERPGSSGRRGRPGDGGGGAVRRPRRVRRRGDGEPAHWSDGRRSRRAPRRGRGRRPGERPHRHGHLDDGDGQRHRAAAVGAARRHRLLRPARRHVVQPRLPAAARPARLAGVRRCARARSAQPARAAPPLRRVALRGPGERDRGRQRHDPVRRGRQPGHRLPRRGPHPGGAGRRSRPSS